MCRARAVAVGRIPLPRQVKRSAALIERPRKLPQVDHARMRAEADELFGAQHGVADGIEGVQQVSGLVHSHRDDYHAPVAASSPLTYPAFYYAVSRASKAGQDRYMQAIRVRLTALVLAAVGGAISWRVGPVEVLAWLALLGFVIALAAEVVIFALHPDQVWYEGRAAAESAKTLSWRYAVAGGPFPAHFGEREADTAFLTQLLAVTRDLKSSFPPPAPGGMSQVTDEMRALRSKSFAERKSVYLSARIDDQREWYGAKSRAADHHNTMFLLATIGFEFLGILAATLRVANVIEFDLLGIVAAVVAGVASWAQTRQYGSIARAYSIASNELATIRSQAASVSEPDWPRFVDGAEEAISREHTLWRASRGVLTS